MKIILSFLFILFFSSCTLIVKNTKPSQINKKEKKTSSIKKKKKKSFESRIVDKAAKDILSKTLTNKQVAQLKKILKNNQAHLFKEQIRMILGRHFFKKSVYKQALSHYSKVKRGARREKARLEKAKIYYQINKPDKARQLINLLLENESSSSDLLLEVYLLKLSIVLSEKSLSQKELLETYCRILSYENKKHSIYRTKIKHLIFNMNEKDLLDVKSEDFIEPVKDLVFFRTGKILFYREKFKRSYRFFKKFLRFSTESILEEKALKYIQAIESRKKVNRKHIGAVLPLSGPSANIGKRSLKGLKMAFGFHTDESHSFQLVVLDSQGQPDKARKAVQTLVTKHHVIAIVGGVLSRTATALAEETQNFGVPAILMSQKSKLTQTGRYVFQNGLTASSISNQLTEFLINQLKIKRFAILYPNDPYGVNYATAFWSEVEKKGGKIMGAQFYKPGETDFNGPIRRLVGTYYLKDRIKEYKEKLKQWYLKKSYLSKERTPPPENILPPVVDFEVLFIPDSIKVLSLIAPHIAYNDIKNIKLAGPTLWNQENFLKKHSKYIDNIIFPDPGLSAKKFTQTDFYKQFTRVFTHKPGLFEVLAYESALVLRQIIASGADTRSELREDLENLKNFYGPMGKIIISKEREFLRPLQIFKMEDNNLSPVTFFPQPKISFIQKMLFPLFRANLILTEDLN